MESFFINIFIFVIAHIIRMQLLEYVTGYSKKSILKGIIANWKTGDIFNFYLSCS